MVGVCETSNSPPSIECASKIEGRRSSSSISVGDDPTPREGDDPTPFNANLKVFTTNPDLSLPISYILANLKSQ